MVEITVNIILVLFCALTFFFVFWKGLKEDYIPSQIFSTSFAILFAAALAYILTEYILIQYRFWFVAAGLISGYIIGCKKTGIKFYEGWDSYIKATLSAFIVSSLNYFKSWNINWILFYCSLIFSLCVFFILKKVYKSFIWYKSGKRGFAGLFAMGVFFLVRAFISFVKPDFTLLLTEYDIFFSGLISFFSFLNIFVLANK